LSAALSAKKRGAMMFVGLSKSDTRPYLDELSLRFHKKGIFVACINSSRSTIVSGESEQIDALKIVLDQHQVFAHKLQIDVAYHSPYMHEIAAEYLEQVKGLEPEKSLSGDPVMIFSVTEEKIFPRNLGQEEYWVRNLISPVRFSQALARLCEQETNMRKKLDCSHLRRI
jgi:acyl transferase domain-containing protein